MDCKKYSDITQAIIENVFKTLERSKFTLLVKNIFLFIFPDVSMLNLSNSDSQLAQGFTMCIPRQQQSQLQLAILVLLTIQKYTFPYLYCELELLNTNELSCQLPSFTRSTPSISLKFCSHLLFVYLYAYLHILFIHSTKFFPPELS